MKLSRYVALALAVLMAQAAFAAPAFAAAGDLDTSFAGDGRKVTPMSPNENQAWDVAIQADGKIVVAGYTGSEPHRDFAVARYDPGGALDTTFGPNHDGKVITGFRSCGGMFCIYWDDVAYDVAVRSNGKIVVAGKSGSAFAAVRYNPDGSLDTSFGGDGRVTTDVVSGQKDRALAVALQPDGKIVAAGATHNNSLLGTDWAMVRYNPNGTLDHSFSGDGKLVTSFGSGFEEAWGVAVQDDGKIVAGGWTSSLGTYDFAVAR